ncbi:hypothetical protein ACIP93_37450 [Streptomyces sp. NPDC088745]|uniref:hypothetical protein n=1 Tax=Streptomyces sp. NPDC088745 TaxID=3365884 RepID=UPI0038263C67
MSQQPPPDRSPEDWRELLHSRPADSDPHAAAPPPRRRKRLRRKERPAPVPVAAGIPRRTAAVRREPVTPLGLLLAVALLLGTGLLVRHLTTDGSVPPAAAPRPSAPAAVQPPPPRPAAPAPAVVPAPEDVSEAWARAYWTRDPVPDRTHVAAVRRAAPWATASLTANLSAHTDRAWGRLVSRGGISTATAVRVSPAGTDLPPDIPDVRVWRTIATTTAVDGYTRYTETHTVRAELLRLTAGWRVSRVLGL